MEPKIQKKNGNYCIMADLAKVENILKKFETMPECNGCTTMVHSGRRIIRRVIKNMTPKNNFKVNWLPQVEQIIQIVLRILSLICLEWFKGYFNNCKCFGKLIYERCYKAWQKIKNDPNCCWRQAKGSS